MNDKTIAAHDYVSRTVGIAILAVATVFIAVSMHLQTPQRTDASQSLPPLEGGALAPRFNADLAYLPNESLLGFVAIPAGSFAMGSDPAVDNLAYENERWSRQQPQGALTLPEFYIGRYEVTVAQFRSFVAATGHKTRFATLQSPGDFPMTDIAWTDALAYARWLESVLKLSPRTPALLKEKLAQGWTLTLPSEAEWEKAARGADGRIFPWGRSASRSQANYNSASIKAVGSFNCSECAYRLADMSGNVWELTRSPLQPYPYRIDEMAADPHSDALYVMRGGSFNDAENNIRAAVRGGIDPGARRTFIGFRLALTQL